MLYWILKSYRSYLSILQNDIIHIILTIYPIKQLLLDEAILQDMLSNDSIVKKVTDNILKYYILLL